MADREFKDSKKMTKEEMETEMLALELEAKRLNVLDLQDRIDERKATRNTKGDTARSRGTTLSQKDDVDFRTQKRCNHQKGGKGAEAVVGGRGNDSQHSVIKHIYINGDMWVRCSRCGKTWKPQLRAWFDFDVKNNPIPEAKGDALFEKAVAEYEWACNLQTSNETSTSHTFTWDQGRSTDYSREKTRYTTMR